MISISRPIEEPVKRKPLFSMETHINFRFRDGDHQWVTNADPSSGISQLGHCAPCIISQTWYSAWNVFIRTNTYPVVVDVAGGALAARERLVLGRLFRRTQVGAVRKHCARVVLTTIEVVGTTNPCKCIYTGRCVYSLLTRKYVLSCTNRCSEIGEEYATR